MYKINKWIRDYNNFWNVIIKLDYNGWNDIYILGH